MPIDENEYQKIVAQLERDWKTKDLVRLAGVMPKVRAIPTGSDEFDFMIGPRRGIPIRRMTRFYGGESSGKSLMAWNTARHAQNIHIIMDDRYNTLAAIAKDAGDKELAKFYIAERDFYLKTWPDGMDVIYYNVEQQFDVEFVEAAGVNIDKLRVVDDTVIEVVGDTLENMIAVGADMHIIDSTTSAITLEELNMDTSEYRRGLEARRWSLMLRRAKQRFKDNNTGIFISQVRIDQKTQAEYAPGGKYLDHAADLVVHYKAGRKLFLDKNGVLRAPDETEAAKTLSGLKEPDGREVTCQVEKSRVGRPFLTARMRLGFQGMKIDRMFELKEAAVWHGIVEKKNGWYTLPSGKKCNGEAAIRDAIAEDGGLQQQIRETWHAAHAER
jgi:RecA/RadA recombinase